MNRLPGLSIGRTSSRNLSALDVGMSSDQVEIQEQTFSTQDVVRSLQDSDLILYTVAIRCSLHPYAFDPSKKLIGGSAGNALMIMRQIFTCGMGDPLTNKFNPGGFELLLGTVKNYLKEHSSDEQKEVFYCAIKKYYEFLKTEAPGMVKSERYHVTDFLTVFAKRLKEQIDGFPQLSSESFEEYVQRFVTLTTGKEFSLSDLPPNARKFVRSNSSPIFKKRRSTVSSYELASESNPELSAGFLSPDDLQKIFGVSNHQHEVVLETERRNPFPESVLMELRLRMFLIDNHPVYNKDGFLQKTGAFLQWKTKETEKILKLVEKLKQTNVADRAKIEEFEESMDPHSPKRLEWLGRMLVTVIEAQGLQGKGGKKSRKYYCTLKLKENALKTRTVQEGDCPYWNEQFYVDISDYSEAVQLKVWQDRAESSKFSDLLSEHKSTGKIVIPLGDLKNVDGGVIDRWYDLRRGSERIYSTGRIHLRIQMLHFDRSKSSKLLNFHELFDSLSQRIFSYSHEHPEVRERGENFLDEFGKRYGVRRFYRMTRQIELFLQECEEQKKPLDYREIHQLLSNIYPERIKLTHLEYSKWISCARAILERFTEALEHFRERFPLSNPPGELGCLLSSLSILFQDRLLQNEMEWSTPDFSKYAFNLVKLGTEEDYDALVRATEPLGRSYSLDDEVKGFVSLVQALRNLLENDRLYFNETFSWYINLPEATINALIPQLLGDLSGSLHYNEEMRSKHSLELLVALKQFHSDCIRVLPQEAGRILNYFDFSLFEPHMERALLETQEKCTSLISSITAESLPFTSPGAQQPATAESLSELLDLLGGCRDSLVQLTLPNFQTNLLLAHGLVELLRLETTQFAGNLLSAFLEAYVSPILSKDSARFFTEEEEFEIPPQFSTLIETIDQLHHFIEQSDPLLRSWIDDFCTGVSLSNSQESLVLSLKEGMKMTSEIFEALMEESIQSMVTHMAVTIMNKVRLAITNFGTLEIPKIFTQSESSQTLEKQRQFTGSIIFYLNQNVAIIADTVRGKEIEFKYLSQGLKVLWKRLSSELKALFLKGVQRPYSEKQMKFFTSMLREVRDLFDFFESQRGVDLPKMEWWEKVIHWADLPTNRLIPKTFNKLGKEDSELILCLINSRTKKEKIASNFVKDQLENSKRILKWSRFLERNSRESTHT